MPPQRTVFVLLFCLLAIPSTAPSQDQPSSRNPVRNSLVGAGIGAVSGAIFGATAPESCCVPLGWSRGEAALLWGGSAAGIGAMIGFATGELGREPLPAWKTALIGGGMGGVLATIPALLVGWDSDAGYIVAFGAGAGLVTGGVVGALGRSRHGRPVMGGQAIFIPSPNGIVIGWRRPLRR